MFGAGYGMEDDYGWSLEWLQYSKDSSSPFPKHSALNFKEPDEWQDSAESRFLSISPDDSGFIVHYENSRREVFMYRLRRGLFSSHVSGIMIRSAGPIPPMGTFVIRMEVLDGGLDK